MADYFYAKEQIRETVKISQIVERYANVKPIKCNRYLCPLHNEKTGSFFVNDSSGQFYCQGCGKGGDFITFLTEYLGITFKEAIETVDNDFCLGLLGAEISVEAKKKMNAIKRKHDKEEAEKKRLDYEYDLLCAKYKATSDLLNKMKPMSDIWGIALTKKAFLEDELNKHMR